MSLAATLTTERLLLRPFAEADLPALVQLAGSYQVARNTLHIPHPYTEEDAQFWLSITQQHRAQGTAHQFALELRDTGEFIGGSGLLPELRHHRAEAGYWLGAPYWGRGLATEALGALLRFGFEQLELNKIFATHHAENLASGRVMEKCGLTLEGRLPQHVWRDGQYLDLWQYGLLRQHYRP